MNYAFSNLLGAPYRGGTLLFSNDELLSPVGNRISVVDLVSNSSSTLPFEAIQQLRTLAMTPDGRFLLAIDEAGRALLINKTRRALLSHVSFKGPVRAAKFSPDGQHLAVGVGRLVQIWEAPGRVKSMTPLHLVRTYGVCSDDITCLDWSPDSLWIAAGSKDLSARVFSLNPLQGYRSPLLAGHKDRVVGVFWAELASLEGNAPATLYTVTRDGALLCWRHFTASRELLDQGGGLPDQEAGEEPEGDPGARYQGGHWRLMSKHFFNHRGAKLTAVDYHPETCMLVAGFTNGIFQLYEMPGFRETHALSVSRESISTAVFNKRGDWLALGCAALGQLLVWEWRSETYVLKQQGHHYDVSCVAFSPDGGLLATGADDAKVKMWLVSSGFCFVTFAEHTGPVTGVAFLPSASAVLSSSLDGTVRAWDLVRYRNFRTLTTPSPTQFACLAVDPSGEVVCAGSMDTYHIYVWQLKTSRLLDEVGGHEGPVISLAFSPTQPLLASASWDQTVRTWDIFSGKGGMEVLQHHRDVVACAFRPDGRQLAAATLDGNITLWDPLEGNVQGTIEGRRDISGGRLTTDRRSGGNSTAGRCFTSLAYSADGSFLLAAGASKYVCMYSVPDRLLLRRIQISLNKSLDGILDYLNSGRVTDAGPLDLIDNPPSDDDDPLLPLTTSGGLEGESELPGTGGKRKAAVRSRCVALSPSGRCWAAATTSGLLLYSLDQGLVFDPTDLGEDVTPQAAQGAVRQGAYLRGLLIALRLKDAELCHHAILSTPPSQVELVVAGLPTAILPELLQILASLLATSPHVQFVAAWLKAVCIRHGSALQSLPPAVRMAPLRAVQRAATQVHTDLASAAESNLYKLRYFTSAPRPAPQLPA